MSKILVIDDEEIFRQATAMALQRKGFETHEASDGAEGEEKARQLLPDLIICDVNMDKKDGYALLESLRQEPNTAAIPFILMTGMGDATSMRRGMNLGADDYLAKPFTAPQLFSAVDARLRKSQILRKNAEKKLSQLRANLSLALPHEMITPLNGIFGLAHILSTDAESLNSAEVADYGANILQSAERLHRTVQNFLLFGQLQIQADDPAGVAALRQNQTSQVRLLIESRAAHVATKADRAADLVLQVTDATLAIGQELLTKMVDELVDNAFKFSAKGSPVTVSGCLQNDGYALSITDRGQGMTAEQIANIGAYTQFNRRSQEQQGSGLGLAIARQISELLGGQFSVQSDAGTGTKIAIILPVAALSA